MNSSWIQNYKKPARISALAFVCHNKLLFPSDAHRLFLNVPCLFLCEQRANIFSIVMAFISNQRTLIRGRIKSLCKKRRVVKCYYEKLQRKGLPSVASFSKSLLRSNRQECSARCPRLGAPKFPALFCGMSVMSAGRWFAGGSRKLSLLTWAGWQVTAVWAKPGTLPAGPRPGWHFSALSLGLVQPPVLLESLLWLPPPPLLEGFTPLLSQESPE